MFKKAKRKIVISIFIILCAVVVGTLAMVNISSYQSAITQNFQILERHAEIMTDNAVLEQNAPLNELPTEDTALNDADLNDKGDFGRRISGDGRIEKHLEIDTFYSVKLSGDGTEEVLENGADGLYSDEVLIETAKTVCTKEKGRIGEMLFIVTERDGDAYVFFMDNASFSENSARLFLFTLLFGVIAIVVITCISVKIADRIIAPMEEGYQKQKQFTADAGHELKTPIAAMAANIELLQREMGDNKWLSNIAYENARMKDLVTELLELARNENKKAERKPTDLSHLVNGVVLPMEAAAFEKNILIESEIMDGVTANIDEKGIEKLVSILVDNAISHTCSENGEIAKVSISLKLEKNIPVLLVSNPGEAIPEAEREKLFERFYRQDSSHEFSGHYGLGLAIAKAIAVANDASISVLCHDQIVTFKVVF